MGWPRWPRRMPSASTSPPVLPALADFLSVKRRLEVHRRGAAASPSTTTSPTTRPRSRPRSRACARGSAPRGSSWRWSRAATPCAWARMPTRSRRRWTSPTVVFLHRPGAGLGCRQGRRGAARRRRGRADVDALIARCATRARRRPRRVHVQRRFRRRAAPFPRACATRLKPVLPELGLAAAL